MCESQAIAEKISSGEMTLCETKGKSKVWEVFAKIMEQDGSPVKNFVSCRHCKKLLKYSNYSTSNLVKHKCYLVKSRSEIFYFLLFFLMNYVNKSK